MHTGTGTNSAEIKTHRTPTALHKCSRKRLYYLVVHGSAEQGVWVSNDSHTAQCIRVKRLIHSYFDGTG
jgi:hypothetical protein